MALFRYIEAMDSLEFSIFKEIAIFRFIEEMAFFRCIEALDSSEFDIYRRDDFAKT
jgi:hypothetical protein